MKSKFCHLCRYNLLLHKTVKEPIVSHNGSSSHPEERERSVCPDFPPIPETEPLRQSEVNATQEGGEHYKKLAIQHWDFVTANKLGYLEGCATKYIIRHQDKNGAEDLKKALHYIHKMLDVYYPNHKEKKS